jgi:hypothetical protein
MIDPKGLKDDAERIADRLTVILGLTGLLKDGAFGAITERQSRALQETIETSEELKELLRPIFFDDKSFHP